MKKQELIKIIEAVVHKEVKKQMNEIFIKEENSSSLTELVSKPLTEKEFKEPIRKQYKAKPKKEVHYTSDETLNKVLNETVGGIPQGAGEAPQVEGYEEYPTLTGEVFDSNRVDELAGGSGGDVQRQRDIAAVQTVKEKGLNVGDVPEDLMNALTKDYTEVLKKSEEISKNRQGV